MELGAHTAPIHVDSLGLRIAVARFSDGTPVGSIAVQTVVGSRDSRLVIKLGEIKYGALEANADHQTNFSNFSNDLLRIRVQWSELRITLDEGRPIIEKNQAFVESAMDRIREAAMSPSSKEKSGLSPLGSPAREKWVDARKRISSGGTDEDSVRKETSDAVCTILFHRYVSGCST